MAFGDLKQIIIIPGPKRFDQLLRIRRIRRRKAVSK
jgi:hypothetical protein